ncbi:MAG: HAD family hydrolase [Deferrisomatales bacterium]
MNGTLAVDGEIAPEVAERLERLARRLRVVVATADTFGTARRVLAIPGVEVRPLAAAFGSAQKEKILEQLAPETAVAVGNGVNDHRMMARAALGIAVLGPEGAAWETLKRAQVVVARPHDALDLLLEPKRLVATLRD